MGIAFGRVEEEVTDASASDVLVLGRYVGEAQPFGNRFRRPGFCRRTQIALAKVRETQEPENSFGYSLQDPEPSAKSRGFNLEVK